MSVASAVITKTCSICDEIKPVDEFSPHPNGRHGVQGYCKECQARNRREKYASDPVYRNWQKRSADARSRALEQLAGMYPATFTQLLNAQRAKVGLPPTERPKRS
jgi:hypothetical protein